MSPGDLLTFSTTILQQKITGPYPLSQYFCNVFSFKKKKHIFLLLSEQNNKGEKYGKEQPFPTNHS